jgi:hypothetical protein
MSIKDWKLTVLFLGGMGVCVFGYHGLARRLLPHAPAVPRESVPATTDADEDEGEEWFPFPEWVEAEA